MIKVNVPIDRNNLNSGSKEYTLNETKELEKFRDEIAFSIDIGELKKIEQLENIYNNFSIIDALRINYLGETKNYKFLPNFHLEGFKLESYLNLSKLNLNKLNSKKVSKTRSLSFVNFPFVSKNLKFLKNFVNLRKLSLNIYGDKEENPIDLSALGEIDVAVYEGLSFLNIDFRYYPMGSQISISSLKNSNHLSRLSLMTNFMHSLVDLDILATFDKLKLICLIGWEKIELLESLLTSSSLETIYLDLNLYNQVDQSLIEKFKSKNIKVLTTDATKEKIFAYLGIN